MVRNKFCFLDSTLQPLGTVGTFPLLALQQIHLVLCELTGVAEACKLQRLNKVQFGLLSSYKIYILMLTILIQHLACSNRLE